MFTSDFPLLSHHPGPTTLALAWSSFSSLSVIPFHMVPKCEKLASLSALLFNLLTSSVTSSCSVPWICLWPFPPNSYYFSSDLITSHQEIWSHLLTVFLYSFIIIVVFVSTISVTTSYHCSKIPPKVKLWWFLSPDFLKTILSSLLHLQLCPNFSPTLWGDNLRPLFPGAIRKCLGDFTNHSQVRMKCKQPQEVVTCFLS